MLALALSRSDVGTRLSDDDAISEEEARKFPHAERVPGTLILREVDERDFSDTLPSVGVPSMK